VPSRYFFNLVNGHGVIRDEDGIELADIRAALIYAFEAIEELRREDTSSSDSWQGWRLDILNSSGQLVHSLPLDDAGPNHCSSH
jgi:hypothetical protein